MMATNAEQAFEQYKANIGKEEGVGEWFEMTQDRINAFADTTLDHQFIHVDPVKAAELSPWKVTIAHGFLTLSMLVHLSGSVPRTEKLSGVIMGVNYGFDKVRFISPVKVGSNIRVRSTLKDAQLKGNNIDVTRTMTVEIDGEDKPALVADWITRLVFG
jgi:acyl dehydratase